MRDEPEKLPAFDLGDRTKEFALRIVRMFAALPRTEEAMVLGKQVLKSGTSVGANYREAQRGMAKPEFIAKIGDCIQALDRTEYWLELLVESNIVPAAKLSSLQDETRQLLAILMSVSKKSKLSA